MNFLYGLLTGMFVFLVIEFIISAPLALVVVEAKDWIYFNIYLPIAVAIQTFWLRRTAPEFFDRLGDPIDLRYGWEDHKYVVQRDDQ